MLPLALSFLSTVAAGAFAREPQGGPERPLETRVSAVSLFKNGFAFVRREGEGTFYGVSYDRVRVKGEIRATNRKREAVRLEITKLLQGEVTKNPNEGKVVLQAKGLRRVNPNVRLTWTVAIEPGQTAAIEYEYSIFVRQ